MTVQRNMRDRFAISARVSLTLGLSAALAAMSVPVLADDIDEIQRRDLALIQRQIEQIEVVIKRIDARQQQADPSTRLYFDVPRLRHDLDTIASGIDAWLAPIRMLPRRPEPLTGDYVDDRGA